tara:strand:+ start:2065 stop:3852 length:1788 start_codon:yes stop_codon:yes gene_type:complete
MKYPKDYLDEIKLRLKVSQVVGKSVQLKKRGKEFIGLSPFKNEKTPSFTVSDEKGFYHCFSTGEHGNIFDFVMKTKSLKFGEAVRLLASEAGMPAYRFTKIDEEKERKFEAYKNIYIDYENIAINNLLENRDNKLALDYLLKRGLNKDVIEYFNIGFIPKFANIYEKLLKKYSPDEIKATELFFKNEKSGKFIDRFNSRILFPIKNISNYTIAFGGRVIDENNKAKYINSPETEFYKKGNIVFNLNKAREERMSSTDVLIVEGYMDVISLYSRGIKNVVSNSGIALKEIQMKLIWRFFKNSIICLDGDTSGQEAANRIAQKFLPIIDEKNKIFFSIMPKGTDPDDYIKENGKEKFKNLLEKKLIIHDFIWEYNINKINKNDPFAISKFEKDLRKMALSIQDEVLKKYILEEYTNKIKTLTPSQNYKNYKNYKNFKKNDAYILNETKNIFKKTNDYTKGSLIELSILYIFLFNINSVKGNIEDFQNINFINNERNSLKKDLISYILDKRDLSGIVSYLLKKFSALINEIEQNSQIKLIIKKKSDEEIVEIFQDLLNDLAQTNRESQIDSIEKNLINNFDENSYADFLRLKTQINGE